MAIGPFGQYHWIEIAGQEVSKAFPPNWQFADLVAIEEAGHIKRVGEWQNPTDERHRKVVYGLSPPKGCEWWTIGQPTMHPPQDESFLRQLAESGFSTFTGPSGLL